MASTRANRMETTLSDGIRRRRRRRHVKKNISVRKLNGEIVKLEVDPMETIAGVKSMIEEDIHPGVLQIELDGEVLDDDRTLANIQKDSTLTLTQLHHVEPSPPLSPRPPPQVPDVEMESTEARRMEAMPPVQRSPVFAGTRNDDNTKEGLRRRLLRGDYIFIKFIHVDETFTLKVDLTETIASVKAKIQEKGILLPQPELYFKLEKLKNDYTLADYGIQRNSTVYLAQKLSSPKAKATSGGERKRISVRTLTGRDILFEVDLAETVAGLMAMLFEETGLLPVNQRLIFSGKRLEDDSTLADYNVGNGSIFHLVPRMSGGAMGITVEKPDGEPFNLLVSGNTTISQIKYMIYKGDEEQGIPQEQTRLQVKFNGQLLDDNCTLDFYMIGSRSTLILVDPLGGESPSESRKEYGLLQTEQTTGSSAPAAGAQGRDQLSSGTTETEVPPSQVVHGSDARADQLRQKQQRSYKYSIKTRVFGIAMLASYLSSASASFSPGKMAFKIVIGAFFIIDATLSIWMPPNWSSVLIYLSWVFLELVSYILLVSFNKYYSYAILPAVFLAIIAGLHHRLQPGATQQIRTHNEANHNVHTQRTDQDHVAYGEDDQSFDYIFDSSAEIVNCGGLITAVFGNSMVGPASALGFLFFNTIALGLYLMMVTTVRTVALTRHARCLAKLLKVLLVITLIIALIHGTRTLNDSGA